MAFIISFSGFDHLLFLAARARCGDPVGARQGRHRVHHRALDHADARRVGPCPSLESCRRAADRREHRIRRRAEYFLARPVARAQPAGRRVLLRAVPRTWLRGRIARHHAPYATGNDSPRDLRLQPRCGDRQSNRVVAALRVLESPSPLAFAAAARTARVDRAPADRIRCGVSRRHVLPLPRAGRRILGVVV